MLAHIGSRNSAITFDVGTAGVRAFQLNARGHNLVGRDLLNLELPPAQPSPDSTEFAPEYGRIARLVGQGNFTGCDVGLVLSPPDVRFCSLKLPKKALAQPEKRLREALAWEVAREMRADAHELEVRHWQLPEGHRQGTNVMAVALPIERALTWHQLVERGGARLRRIDVSPCTLAHLGGRIWTPENNDLWGILDLGYRATTLTVVLGRTPTYIRSLTASSAQWTRRLAESYELSLEEAEQVKRSHGIRAGQRGLRAPEPDQALLDADDIPAITFGLLRERLDQLVRDVNLCFSYVMQNYADVNASRLLLTGGGANMPGLAGFLELQLGLPTEPLASNAGAESTAWERPLPGTNVTPESAAAVGGALLDVDAGSQGGRANPALPAPCTVNLLPESCHNARRRLVRRNAWTAVAACAFILLAGTWVALRAAGHAIDGLGDELAAVQATQVELERQLVLAATARNGLADQSRGLETLRHEQPLPRQLLAVAQRAPEGIVLTEILADSDTGGGWNNARLVAPIITSQAASEPRPLTVRISGYAVDHEELTRLIAALKDERRWEQVELLRAAREPYRQGEALAFRLECRPGGVTQ